MTSKADLLRPRFWPRDNLEWLGVIIWLLIIFGLIGLIVYLIVSWDNLTSPDPFNSKCNKQGGELAYISHGKSRDDLCIKDNVVLFRR